MSTLSIDTIYSEARSEVLDHAKRLAATRSWAIASIGGVSALVAGVLAEGPRQEALLHSANETTVLILILGALVNLALWTISMEHARGIVRMGVYLLFLERDAGRPKGWEHWIWLRYSKGLRTLFSKVLGDVMFWISLAYVVGCSALFANLSSSAALAGVVFSVLCLGIGLGLRGYTHHYRRKAYREIAEHWPKPDWFRSIARKYGVETSEEDASSPDSAKTEDTGEPTKAPARTGSPEIE